MSEKLLVALSVAVSLAGISVAYANHHNHGHEPMVKAMTPELVVQMVDLNTNKPIGTIGITETAYGVVFTPNIKDASIKSAGMHGFHMHTNPSCAPSKNDQGKEVLGGGAGGHFDPAKTNSHGHPWTDNNHLGDLPAIYLSSKGEASSPVLAPRLKMADLPGHSLMIHVGGDNYSNMPTLGGGGARMLCGVIKENAGMDAKAGAKK